jgi:predicted nucleic acid-binding protein
VIVYLDASALVKRYLAEEGSPEVNRLIAESAVIATSLLSRAEVAAAIARSVRVGAIPRPAGEKALQALGTQWPDLMALPVTALLVARASELAWAYGLRGYDAIHLSSALLWQEDLGEPVVVATFDRELEGAAVQAGMRAWPAKLGQSHG